MDFEYKEQYHFEDLLQVMRILRSDEGCMWDRQQDHHSIRRDFIEETYEVCEAIDNEDVELLKEELGDVLFQVVFHTTIEEEQGHFDINDVIDGICKKMIYRHPHVFKDVKVHSTQDILNNWDDLKKTEKHQRSVTDTMDSVARTLPALIRAEKVMKKAEKVGFEWASVDDALDKVQEELDEVRRAEQGDGDFLLVPVAAHIEGGSLDAYTGIACMDAERTPAVVSHFEEGFSVKLDFVHLIQKPLHGYPGVQDRHRRILHRQSCKLSLDPPHPQDQ